MLGLHFTNRRPILIDDIKVYLQFLKKVDTLIARLVF
jgi:hypothetical protein